MARARSFSIVAACVAIATSGGGARAEDAPAALSVTRGTDATDCPDTAALVEATNRALRRRAVAVSGAGDGSTVTRMTVSFERTPSAYVGRARVVGPRGGERALSDPGPTCAPLAEAIVLTLSLLLDELASEPPPPIAAAPPAPPEASIAPPSVAGPVPAPPRARGGLDLELAAGGATGLVRPWAPFVSLAATWAVPSAGDAFFSFGLGGFWVPTQSLPLAPGTVDVSLAAAQAFGCFYPWGRRASWRVGGCVGPSLGAARATGRGYSTEGGATSVWIAGGVALVGGGPLAGPIGWRARVGAAIPLHPRAFAVDNVGTAYDPPPVAGLADLGLSASIP